MWFRGEPIPKWAKKLKRRRGYVQPPDEYFAYGHSDRHGSGNFQRVNDLLDDGTMIHLLLEYDDAEQWCIDNKFTYIDLCAADGLKVRLPDDLSNVLIDHGDDCGFYTINRNIAMLAKLTFTVSPNLLLGIPVE